VPSYRFSNLRSTFSTGGIQSICCQEALNSRCGHYHHLLPFLTISGEYSCHTTLRTLPRTLTQPFGTDNLVEIDCYVAVSSGRILLKLQRLPLDNHSRLLQYVSA